MDQQKIGAFLRELRKKKKITQEQFAEMLNVSNRTISRWENGNNLPDLDVLMQIADYYEVELRELLNGEYAPKQEQVQQTKLNEDIIQVVNYSSAGMDHYKKRMRFLLWLGAILWILSQIISHTSMIELKMWERVYQFAQGMVMGMFLGGIFMTSRYGRKIRELKGKIMRRYTGHSMSGAEK